MEDVMNDAADFAFNDNIGNNTPATGTANTGDYHNGNGGTWGTMYVISNVDEKGGVVFNSGHAWIRLESADGSIVTTMSIWGNTGEQEFWVDKELGDGYGAIYKSTEISVDQFNKIDAFNNISTNIDWTTSYTCAGYSAALWNHVTGGSLSSTAWGGYSTPGALAASMIATGRYSRTYSDDKKKSSK